MTSGSDETGEEPWEIVREYDRDDGEHIWVRRDGVELTDMWKNRWYVLATLHGEQIGDSIDEELAAKNRRAWNLWACQGLSAEQRAALAEKTGLSEDELGGAWEVERDELKILFQRRNPAAQLPEPNETVDLSASYFPEDAKLVCFGYLMPAAVQFQFASFGGYVDFANSTFCGKTSFSSTVFHGVAGFGSTKFEAIANYDSATFLMEADFGDARFGKRANFQSVVFEQLDGASAEFRGPADFRNARFGKTVDFTDAKFLDVSNGKRGKYNFNIETGDASFEGAVFFGKTIFHQARFAGSANFGHVAFHDEVYFRPSKFEGPANFRSCKFGGVSDFREVEFSAWAPSFHASTFYQDMRFSTDMRDELLWPTPTPNTAEDDRSAYARLRQFMNEAHNPDNEHFFLRREMQCKALLEPFWEQVWIALYRRAANYGHSIWRPFFALGVLVTAGWLVLNAYFAWRNIIWGDDKTGWEALGLSFSNTFGFLGFNRLYFGTEYWEDFHPFLKFMGAVQTILGVIFLFFLGLGLRNRFRLK